MKRDRYRALAFVAALAAVCLLVLCFVAPPVHAEPNHPQEVAMMADLGVQSPALVLQQIPAVLMNQHDPQPPPCKFCCKTMSKNAILRSLPASPPVHVDWPDAS